MTKHWHTEEKPNCWEETKNHLADGPAAKEVPSPGTTQRRLPALSAGVVQPPLVEVSTQLWEV